MKCAIVVYETPSELAAREDPARIGGYWSAYTVYSQALAKRVSPPASLAAADVLPTAAVAEYQPWWALRAHLLAELGRMEAAARTRARAAGLTRDPAIRAFLLRQDVAGRAIDR